MTGEATLVERAYVLHRIDVERVRVLDARATRCDQDLGVCEQRVASIAAPSDSGMARAAACCSSGLGLLAGMGLTAGIAIVLE